MPEKKESTGITQEEFQAFMQEYANSPAAKQANMLKMFNSALNVGANIMDLGISRKQISESQRLQKGLAKPDIYKPVRDRGLLSQQIREAQRGISDVSRDLAPAELANLDQYLKDIGTARIASTGQASTFGSLANAAAMRRRRGGLDIAALGSRIKGQRRGELAGLTAMDLQAKAENDRLRLARSGMLLEQYQKEAGEAASLGATGRLNLRNTMYRALPNISQFGQQLGKSGIGEAIGGLFQGSVDTGIAPLGADAFGGSVGDDLVSFDQNITDGFQNLFTGKVSNPYWNQYKGQ